ncbi:sensor histidine kinase, partial [Pseudomonas syringae pv. tagetis]
MLVIALLIWWLYLNISHHVKDLARRMRQLDPMKTSQRITTAYRNSEQNTIAQETNEHLQRVEIVVERERSLLD